MRHRKSGRKLGRPTAHRRAMMSNLATSLFDNERITTTLPKAKELRSFAERLITRAKKDSLHSRRLVARVVHDKDVLRKLFDQLSPRYADRPGGYTRIYKLGYRKGDSAEMAVIELVDRPEGIGPESGGGAGGRRLVERDEDADAPEEGSGDDSASDKKSD
jgi:large subunit ribosomal protein L17